MFDCLFVVDVICLQAAGEAPCCLICGQRGSRLATCEFCHRRCHLDCMDPPLARFVYCVSYRKATTYISKVLFTILCYHSYALTFPVR